MEELAKILMSMGFLIVDWNDERLLPSVNFRMSEKEGHNSIEVCYYEEGGWFTVHFPDYLSHEEMTFDGINKHNVVKYAHMKTIEDVLSRLQKAPYRNETIKNSFVVHERNIKLKELIG